MKADQVAISVWYSLSFSHLRLADELARLSYEIEEKHDAISFHPNHELVKPYAIGSIMASVSFVEANINEFLNGLTDMQGSSDFPPQFTRIKDWWERNKDTRGLSIVAKYQKCLGLANVRKYRGTDILFSDLEALVYLRNRLVHYKPEWITIDSEIEGTPKTVQRMEELLKDKFEISKFYNNSSTPYFPNKCLGYGCTRWSLHTALNFATDFYKKINIEPPYNHIVKRLTQFKS